MGEEYEIVESYQSKKFKYFSVRFDGISGLFVMRVYTSEDYSDNVFVGGKIEKYTGSDISKAISEYELIEIPVPALFDEIHTQFTNVHRYNLHVEDGMLD
jgi:hypothetical protein